MISRARLYCRAFFLSKNPHHENSFFLFTKGRGYGEDTERIEVATFPDFVILKNRLELGLFWLVQ